jgi:hypothetical protein
MSETMLNYSQSPVPPSRGGFSSDQDPDKQIKTVNGEFQYAHSAREGMVQVWLPGLPGDSHGEERLLAKDFGPFVATKIESSFQRQPYMRSGPTQRPAVVFSHYIGCAAGSGLMDKAAIGRMQTLAKEFEGEANQREYFEQVLKPYLFSLAPTRRT